MLGGPGLQEGRDGDKGLWLKPMGHRSFVFKSKVAFPTGLEVGKAAAVPVGSLDYGGIADLDRDPGSKVGMEGGPGLQEGRVDVHDLWFEPLGRRSLVSEYKEVFPAGTLDAKVKAGLKVGLGLIAGQVGGLGSWVKSMGHQSLVVESEITPFPIGLGNAKVSEAKGFFIQKRSSNLMHSMVADVNGTPHSLGAPTEAAPNPMVLGSDKPSHLRRLRNSISVGTGFDNSTPHSMGATIEIAHIPTDLGKAKAAEVEGFSLQKMPINSTLLIGMENVESSRFNELHYSIWGATGVAKTENHRNSNALIDNVLIQQKTFGTPIPNDTRFLTLFAETNTFHGGPYTIRSAMGIVNTPRVYMQTPLCADNDGWPEVTSRKNCIKYKA